MIAAFECRVMLVAIMECRVPDLVLNNPRLLMVLVLLFLLMSGVLVSYYQFSIIFLTFGLMWILQYPLIFSHIVSLSQRWEIWKGREIWRGTVHWVTKSQTWLSNWTTTIGKHVLKEVWIQNICVLLVGSTGCVGPQGTLWLIKYYAKYKTRCNSLP